jgi:farnesol dehydrogenase
MAEQMEKVFVTGSTGFIGLNLCQELARHGYIVHALYRSEKKAKLLDHENIILYKGDITRPESLQDAFTGCRYGFHLGAFADVWSKDPLKYQKVNYEGAANVFRVAREQGVKKLIFTSTAGVFGPSDIPLDEGSSRFTKFFNEYERTKAMAENLAKQSSSEEMPIAIVNPSRVFGPGLLSKSNATTLMMKLYMQNWIFILPGNGKSVGNYVYVADVVQGHILALQHGKGGENYILGGYNLTYREFFNTLRQLSGKNTILIKMPYVLMMTAAWCMLAWAKLTGQTPLIVPRWVKKYNYNWMVSGQKAEKELGHSITPLETAFRETIQTFQQNKDEE